MFLMWKRYWNNAIIKLYGFLWIPFSLIGLFLSVVVWQPVLCETDDFVMRKPGGFMGFETAVLYRKSGLRELEIHRYELVFPESITSLDSLGAVVIYGEYPDEEIECWYPLWHTSGEDGQPLGYGRIAKLIGVDRDSVKNAFKRYRKKNGLI